MSRVLVALLLMSTALVAPWANAGGSFESVRITSLHIVSETDYVLVVTPNPKTDPQWYKDPFMGFCATFTVQGSYSRVYPGYFPRFITRQAHVDALAHLRRAYDENRSVNLGWMGTGF